MIVLLNCFLVRVYLFENSLPLFERASAIKLKQKYIFQMQTNLLDATSPFPEYEREFAIFYSSIHPSVSLPRKKIKRKR